MTPEQCEELRLLRQQQMRLQSYLPWLQENMTALDRRIQALESLPVEPPPVPAAPPPLPQVVLPRVPQPSPPPLPNLVPVVGPIVSAPVPQVSTPTAQTAPLPQNPRVPIETEIPSRKEPFEVILIRWLTRLGVLIGIIFLASLSNYGYLWFNKYLSPASKLIFLSTVASAITWFGFRLERSNYSLRLYGRLLSALGLASIYYLLYAAYNEPLLKVISSAWLDGTLLLIWSGVIFWLADSRKSQTLSIFAILLAYFSSAINPLDNFTMFADSLLAITAVIFFLRHAWASLTYLSMLATYLALLRRLVLDSNWHFLDFYHPPGIHTEIFFLNGSWFIFTAAIFLSTSPKFQGGERLTFLSLNNGAYLGLTCLALFLSGEHSYGWTLLLIGFVFLLCSVLGRLARRDSPEVSGAYLSQGLILTTGGFLLKYGGTSRALILALEALFLGAAGAYTRHVILRLAAYLVSFLATIFLLFEISFQQHSPWLLSLSGLVIMLGNAWLSRRDVHPDANLKNNLILSSSYYCVLGLGLLFTGLYITSSEEYLSPFLALWALGLTLSVYILPLFELPPLAQGLLICAQLFSLFPDEQINGPLPWWNPTLVGIITLSMATWWRWQKVTRSGGWVVLLKIFYALVFAALIYHGSHPFLSKESWLIACSIFSLLFLFFGAVLQLWSFAAIGQIFILVATFSILKGLNTDPYPYNWISVALPIAVIYGTGRMTHISLPFYSQLSERGHSFLSILAYGYYLLALALACLWIKVQIPSDEIPLIYFTTALFLISYGRLFKSSFTLRCSYFMSALGILILHEMIQNQLYPPALTWAVFLFLLQPAFIGLTPNATSVDRFVIVFFSTISSWYYGTCLIIPLHLTSHYLTLIWTLVAMVIIILGWLAQEKLQRWAALVVLICATVRLLIYDLWQPIDGVKLITCFVLAVFLLVIGFIYAWLSPRFRITEK